MRSSLTLALTLAGGATLLLVGCAPRDGGAPQNPTTTCVPSEPARTAAAAPSSPASLTPEVSVRRFELAQSEVRTVHSPETGRDYSIAVRLPDSFAEEPDQKYPALFVLDGQWNFELLHRIVNNLVFDQAIPETIVVGIAPGGESPNYDLLRREDFLPTRAVAFDGKTSGGDAPQFLRFLAETLIPLVEREYRTDPAQRLLSGASYGGLFVLYALFEKPDLFDAYFAMSPAVTWDDRWAFGREQAFHTATKRIDAHVWLSVGSNEWPRYVAANRAFFEQFERRRYEGIRLDVRTIEGEAHAGHLPEAHTRSLRFYFDEWAKAKRATEAERAKQAERAKKAQ